MHIKSNKIVKNPRKSVQSCSMLITVTRWSFPQFLQTCLYLQSDARLGHSPAFHLWHGSLSWYPDFLLVMAFIHPSADIWPLAPIGLSQYNLMSLKESWSMSRRLRHSLTWAQIPLSRLMTADGNGPWWQQIGIVFGLHRCRTRLSDVGRHT